ncbi:MAG: glycosyltransferase family 39 protein [Acidobacteriaceae bacterium]
MRLRGFSLERPQRVAALLLLVLFGQCLWTIGHQPLDANDLRYARCGCQMGENPSFLQSSFTTCGNLNHDGALAYRLAGLPLAAQHVLLLTIHPFRQSADQLSANCDPDRGAWQARHPFSLIPYLLRLPFILFAVWLGGGLWWVAKRLFGPEGGALALALYTFCPAIVRYATHPNNEVLAMWGLYGLIYTAIGVGHALQGPRSMWRPRILLLTVALGLTTSAHLLAGVVGFLVGMAFFFYTADRRRSYVSPIMICAAMGALLIVFAGLGFHISALRNSFTGGSLQSWFRFFPARRFFTHPANAGIVAAAAVALLVYWRNRPSRYFGNTAPLLMALLLFPLSTTQVFTAPWIWALPFLFTFIGGVFADALESQQRALFLVLTVGVVVTQAVLCWASMAGALPG